METPAKDDDFIANCLARAKQVAAKLQSVSGDTPAKRSYEGTPEYQPEAKKAATGDGNWKSTEQSRASQAAALAAAAASQINAKLGVTGSAAPPVVASPPALQTQPGLADPREIAKMLGFTVTTSETTTVPDKMVGYLIGKGGEQITQIQSESQCVVQFAAESDGTAERQCVLTGTPASIAKAKEVLNRLIQKFKTGGVVSNEGSNQVEMMVPGNKVGLIIGKGGETIKGLMESTNTKIVVIQESNVMTNHDKPVRITGESHSCQRAQQKIMELISDKDFHMTNPYGTPVSSDPYRVNIEMPIQRSMIGLVIGKNGEMIRKIQDESGSKVQFKGEDDGTSNSRNLSITGTEETNRVAMKMVSNLIDSAMNKYGSDMSSLQKQNALSGGGRGSYGQDWSANNTYNLPVPTEKCGIIIGKGGETIRDINRISGAFVELDRNVGPNPNERVFKVVGNPDQIQHAVRLITEKANLPNPMMGPDGYCGPMGYPLPMGGPMGVPGMNYRPYGPPSQPGMGGPMGMMGGPMPGQMMQGMMGGGMMPNAQQWASYNQSPYGQTGQMDPSKQSPQPQQQQQQLTPQQQQEQAAAWAAYYAYYGQAMNPMQAGYGGATTSGSSTSPSTTATQSPGTASQAAGNGQAATQDYSAAWAEYYRQHGMHQHAAAIMQQMQQPATTQAQQSPQQNSQAPSQPPQPPQ